MLLLGHSAPRFNLDVFYRLTDKHRMSSLLSNVT